MKKLLALVLALVMTLGLATVGTSAAYSDAADVSLNEAVDVMTAVGVFQGSDGKFSPKENLTREQAAKLIAYLDLGENTAEALPAVKVFDDVEATRWSAKYIAYCQDAGYVAGLGNGKFDPTGELTGYAFGKMVLCALGYDAATEEMVGNNWTIKVAKLMESNKISDGIDSAASLTLTREQAAQYCFNALQANLVFYAGGTTGTTVTTSDGTVVSTATTGTRTTATNANNGNYAKVGAYWDAYTPAAEDGNIQLGEKLYGKNLVPSSTTDDFGRDATKWTYKNEDIVTTADEADQTYVLTANGKTLADVLTGSSYMGIAASKVASTTPVFYNGYATTFNTDKASTLDRGDIVEVYKASNGDVDKVVVRRYTAAKISNIGTSLNSSLTALNATTSIALRTVLSDAPVVTLYDAYKNDSTKVLPGFDAATYIKGAVIAVAYKYSDWAATATTNALDSYVATVVNGTVTSAKANDYAVIGGTQYKFSANMNAPTVDGIITGFAYDGTSYNFYLDANGYVIANDATSSKLDDVYYITGLYIENSTLGTTKYMAQTVALDGTIGSKVLEAQSWYTLALVGGGNKLQVGGNDAPGNETKPVVNRLYDVDYATEGYLFTFDDSTAGVLTNATTAIKGSGTFAAVDKVDNDKFTAVKYTATDAYDYVVQPAILGAPLTSKTTSVAVAGATFVGNGTDPLTATNGSKYVNSDTQFMTIKASGDDLKVATASGSMNVATTGTTQVILIFPDNNRVASHVIVAGGSTMTNTVSTNDIIYLADEVQAFQSDTNGYAATVYTMESGKGSKDVTITSGDSTNIAGFYSYTTNDKGVYDTTTLASTASELGHTGNVTVTSSSNTDGPVRGLVVAKEGFYENILSGFSDGSAMNGGAATDYEDVYGATRANDVTITNVDFGSAVVIDARGAHVSNSAKASKSNDIYSGDITSVETLKEAINAGRVTLDCYLENGKITFIAVRACQNEGLVTVTPTYTDLAGVTVSPVIAQKVTNTTGTVNYTVTVAAGTATGSLLARTDNGTFSAATGVTVSGDKKAALVSWTYDADDDQTFTLTVTAGAADTAVTIKQGVSVASSQDVITGITGFAAVAGATGADKLSTIGGTDYAFAGDTIVYEATIANTVAATARKLIATGTGATMGTVSANTGATITPASGTTITVTPAATTAGTLSVTLTVGTSATTITLDDNT